ncbi:MAG: diaminopimelate decarboxylase [Bacteroidetes bacterium]|nr:diaminopimelate decarboxylase [Bacteroidota bacterium]
MELVGQQYLIGGVPATQIAREFGTPVYVYDSEKIRQQYRRLKKAFSGVNLQIKYACKALSNINVLRLLRQEGSGIDAVSIQEIQMCLHAGFAPEEILFTPNGVSFEEYREAVRLGVRINIDNISILEQFGNEYGNRVPVCIRLNPHIMAGGHSKISTGHIDSKFGISIHQLRHVLRVIQAHNMHIDGLHMHTGSDILDADVFLAAADVILEAAFEFPSLSYLDFGSGFRVPYAPGDVSTDVETLGAKIAGRFLQFCQDYGRELELWFEPGKFLVSEAGHLLVTANVIKTTVSTVFVGVNSGLNHLIRPMLYDAYHEIVNVSNPGGTTRIYTVVGYICETDTLGADRRLNEVHEGDVLAILNAGAYGMAMASNYNCRLRPAEVMVLDGKPHLIRQRETLEDLLRNQVELEQLKEKSAV